MAWWWLDGVRGARRERARAYVYASRIIMSQEKKKWYTFVDKKIRADACAHICVCLCTVFKWLRMPFSSTCTSDLVGIYRRLSLFIPSSSSSSSSSSRSSFASFLNSLKQPESSYKFSIWCINHISLILSGIWFGSCELAIELYCIQFLIDIKESLHCFHIQLSRLQEPTKAEPSHEWRV